MTTYSISLDDVDLALLPLHSHPYNEFLRKEHFEFKVMKTEAVEDSAPTIFYKCHTCAVDVPAAFASEHAASIKHEANARIAGEAALRIRALVSAPPPAPTEQPNARFCANCSTTVSGDHDKTKEHRVAVMHDKLLWELMSAYVGDCNDDGHDSDFNETYNFKRNENNSENTDGTKSGYPKCSANDGEIPKCNNNNGVRMDNIIHDYMKLDKNENDERKGHKIVNFKDQTESYEDKINDTEQHDQFKPIDHNGEIFDFEIVDTKYYDSKDFKIVQKNIKMNKASEKFEIVNNESNNNEIYPIAGTSKMGIEIENRSGNNQENAAPQVAKYTQTQNVIEYVEFMTEDWKVVKVQSDNYHSFIRRENTIECIVCSCTFQCEEADSHVFSVGHLNKIPNVNEYCVRKINEVYSHCILCNQMVKTANVTKHAVTLSHKEKEKQTIANKSLGQKITTPKIEANKANLDSKFKTAVQNVDNKVKIQANGSGAIKKTAGKDTAGIPEEKNKNQNAVKSVNDWPVIYPYELATDDSVRCVICGCKVPNHPANRKGHLTGSNHAKNVAKRRLSHPKEESNDPKVWRCVICECEVPNNRKRRRAHIFGNHVDDIDKVALIFGIYGACRR